MTSRRIKGNHGNRLAESDSSVKLYDRCGIKKPMRKEQLQAQVEKVKAELLKLGRPAIGDYPPVLSFHLPGENSRIGPPFVFPHQDWLLVHFLHILQQRIAQPRFYTVGHCRV